jgi:hypothetical protein
MLVKLVALGYGKVNDVALVYICGLCSFKIHQGHSGTSHCLYVGKAIMKSAFGPVT